MIPNEAKNDRAEGESMPLWGRDGKKKDFYVYILSNSSMTLYVGVTNDLERRFIQHTEMKSSEFTARYHFDRIVHFETYEDIRDAIAREKQIKGWKRERKIELVKATNPGWRDVLAKSSAS